MIDITKLLVQLIAIAIWVAGVVIAKGFWSTFFAFIVPFWAWYLAIERVMSVHGYL